MTGRACSANGLLGTPQGMLDDEWIDEKLLDKVESILGLKGFSSSRRLKELEKDERHSPERVE